MDQEEKGQLYNLLEELDRSIDDDESLTDYGRSNLQQAIRELLGYIV